MKTNSASLQSLPQFAELSGTIAALMLVSTACSAGSLSVRALEDGGSPVENESSWTVVEIPKPTEVVLPTPTAATEPAPPQANPSPSLEEMPVITMVYVEDEAQPSIAAESDAQANSTGKYVLVSISEQHLYAYSDGQLVYSFVASTGMGNSTRVGSFHIQDKIPNAYGANWDIWMPNWMGIYWSGGLENGIHALPILPSGARLWSGYLGTPISFGCVVLGAEEAAQLYEWADVGTPVEIRW